jgi:hypothetical protein
MPTLDALCISILTPLQVHIIFANLFLTHFYFYMYDLAYQYDLIGSGYSNKKMRDLHSNLLQINILHILIG